MTRFAIHVAAILAALLVLMAIWAAIPSSLFLRPITMIYAPDEAGVMHTTLLRETPFGEVTAQWESEVQVIGTGVECPDRGESTYQVIPPPDDASPRRVADTARWPTSDKLLPCITAVRPVVAVHQWRVTKIGDLPMILPLRAVRLTVRLD